MTPQLDAIVPWLMMLIAMVCVAVLVFIMTTRNPAREPRLYASGVTTGLAYAWLGDQFTNLVGGTRLEPARLAVGIIAVLLSFAVHPDSANRLRGLARRARRGQA